MMLLDHLEEVRARAVRAELLAPHKDRVVHKARLVRKVRARVLVVRKEGSAKVLNAREALLLKEGRVLKAALVLRVVLVPRVDRLVLKVSVKAEVVPSRDRRMHQLHQLRQRLHRGTLYCNCFAYRAFPSNSDSFSALVCSRCFHSILGAME